MTDHVHPVRPPGRGPGGRPPEEHSDIRRIRKEGRR